MKLSDYRSTYYELSGKASDASRTLSLAGIAICWIFKVGENSPKLPTVLIPTIALFAIGLGFDLLQYVVGAAIWGSFARIKEKGQKNLGKDPTTDSPAWLNWPSLILFWMKHAAVVMGYISLSLFLIKSWITP
jgi:hypothetical protein